MWALSLESGAICGKKCAIPQTERIPRKKNAKTREVSHKIFVGSLARVWGHLRQEVPHTPGRTDPVKKNAETLEVSHKIFLGSLARGWSHLRQEVLHTAGRTDPVKKNAKMFEVSHKMFLGSLARVWGHLRQEVPQTAGRTDPVKKNAKTLEVSHETCLGSLARVWRPFTARSAQNRREKPTRTNHRLLHRPRAEQARCKKTRRSLCAARAPNRQGVRKYEGSFFSRPRAQKC